MPMVIFSLTQLTPPYWVLENNLVVNALLPETQDEVKGRVVDSETGNPLPGINIFIQATGMGTVTGPDGYFSIEVPGPETVLEFTGTGYIHQVVEIGDQRELTYSCSPGWHH
jgi:hypothetical protein